MYINALATFTYVFFQLQFEIEEELTRQKQMMTAKLSISDPHKIRFLAKAGIVCADVEIELNPPDGPIVVRGMPADVQNAEVSNSGNQLGIIEGVYMPAILRY